MGSWAEVVAGTVAGARGQVATLLDSLETEWGNAGVLWCSHFPRVGTQPTGWCDPDLGWAFLSQSNLSGNTLRSLGDTPEVIFMVILNPIGLTTKVNHSNLLEIPWSPYLHWAFSTLYNISTGAQKFFYSFLISIMLSSQTGLWLRGRFLSWQTLRPGLHLKHLTKPIQSTLEELSMLIILHFSLIFFSMSHWVVLSSPTHLLLLIQIQTIPHFWNPKWIFLACIQPTYWLISQLT